MANCCLSHWVGGWDIAIAAERDGLGLLRTGRLGAVVPELGVDGLTY